MREPAPTDWRMTLRGRTLVAAGLLSLWAIAIEGRLVYLQIWRNDDMVARAARQQMRTITAPAKRGDILDRHGRVLATSVDADSIYAVPSEIENPSQVVAKLCEAFGDCTSKERQSLVDRLGQTRAFAYVRRQVSPDEARRVASLNLDGIGFIKESRRFYPKKELASHLVGYVGIDNTGLDGLEFTYDREIRGKPGTVLIHTDARRHAFSRFERPPTSGSTVELAIDQYLQHVAERELHTGVVENRAAGGSAIIMNPHTGEILAMANEPTFNPNAYRDSDEVDRRNRAVQDLYEPGSTFKVVTASAAIEERVMPVDAPVDVSGGRIKIGARVVRDTHDYNLLSFTDVIVKSSNVGAIKIGFKLGTDRLSEYVRRFRFGRPTSSDFPSENPGIVWDREKWTESALASVSMGYQIGVTPLQMAAAVSSVANQGEYIEPRALRAVYRGDRRYEVRPKALGRTIKPNTCALLTSIMEQVVERGTAQLAQIPGYAIAGKTGTANKLVNGRYSSDTFASFVGFLPSHDPAVTILVMLDSPRGRNGHFGGPVAAPIFKRIAQAAMQYLGVPPSLDPAPPVLVARHDDASDTSIARLESDALVVSLVADGPPGTMPDLTGMSAREAVRTLVNLGLTTRADGDGFVVAQEPAPGAALQPGAVGHVTLERTPLRFAAGASHP